MTEHAARLERCLQRVFPDFPADQLRTATMAAVPQWDSLATLSLVAMVEEEFQIEFALDRLGMLTSFATIEQEVTRALENHQAAVGHPGPGELSLPSGAPRRRRN
jgi:acyl carrier protein